MAIKKLPDFVQEVLWLIVTCLFLLNYQKYNVIVNIRKAPIPKVDASRTELMSLRTPPILWVRQDRHFYFFLFLLSRKARNATVRLPKVANSVSIPMNIEIISNAVISRTSLPMYSRLAGIIGSGGCHPVMGTLLRSHLRNIRISFISSFFNIQ